MKFRESRGRVGNTMVLNPIYDGDGPLYESVQNERFIQLTTDTGTLYNNLQQTLKHQDDDCLSNTARYVDQPAHNALVQTKSTTFNYDPANAPEHVMCGSVPSSTGKLSLKKNGQERNKLHLTLTLSGNANPTKEQTYADETYTAMGSAGAVVINPSTGEDSALQCDAAE